MLMICAQVSLSLGRVSYADAFVLSLDVWILKRWVRCLGLCLVLILTKNEPCPKVELTCHGCIDHALGSVKLTLQRQNTIGLAKVGIAVSQKLFYGLHLEFVSHAQFSQLV